MPDRRPSSWQHGRAVKSDNEIRYVDIVGTIEIKDIGGASWRSYMTIFVFAGGGRGVGVPSG